MLSRGYSPGAVPPGGARGAMLNPGIYRITTLKPPKRRTFAVQHFI